MKHDELMAKMKSDPAFAARVTAANMPSREGQPRKPDTEIHRAAIDRAKTRFETERGKLYRPDGAPVYGPDEHAERMTSLFADFDRVADETRQGAQQRMEAAKQERQTLGADPFYRLTTEQLQRAAALAPFIQQDCERLRFDELAERLTAAVVSDDPVARQLYLRYSRQRRETAVTPQRDGSARTPNGADYQAFGEALRQLEDATKDPTIETKRAEIEQRIQTDQALIIHANRARAELDGTMERAREHARELARGVF